MRICVAGAYGAFEIKHLDAFTAPKEVLSQIFCLAACLVSLDTVIQRVRQIAGKRLRPPHPGARTA